MTFERHSAADQTWREKVDENPTLTGALVLLVVVGIPLILL